MASMADKPIANVTAVTAPTAGVMRRLEGLPERSQQSDQIGQSGDRVILCVAEGFSIAAQHAIHLRGPDRPCRRGRHAAPDPGDLEAEMFRAGDIEAIGRYEKHVIVFQSEPLLDQ